MNDRAPTARTTGLGEPLPDVELIDHNGDPWRVSDALGHPVVLVLHRHLA